MATVLIKLSMLRLYLELFHRNREFRYVCHFLEVLVVLFIIGIILTVAVICRPIEKDWYPLIPGECGNRLGEEIAAATGVLTFDSALVILPMPVLWNLHMTLHKKLVISIMFSVGFMYVTLFSLDRLHFGYNHLTYPN